MKKIVMICLALIVMASMSLSVCANQGGFVSSPSANSAPTLEFGKNESEDCVSELSIAAFSDRDQLSEEARKNIEEAYAMIMGTQDLSTLNAGIADLAKALQVDVASLAVSDLFDISASSCEGHEDHGHFDITLKAETLTNFVCLLHYYNGEWEIVEGAEVTNNGEHLEFDVDEFSPFAIVVSTGNAPVQPTPKKIWPTVVIASASTAAAGGAVYLALWYRKKKL